MPMDPRQTLKSLFDAALAAVSPAHVLPPHLPPPPDGRTVVLGFGKAAAEARWRARSRRTGPPRSEASP